MEIVVKLLAIVGGFAILFKIGDLLGRESMNKAKEIDVANLVFEKNGHIEVTPRFAVGIENEKGKTIATVHFMAVKVNILDKDGRWVERRFPVEERSNSKS
jgi:hypothetical protein